ncbi:hypothetical protein Tco_0522723 [Tanacetum coccineum]
MELVAYYCTKTSQKNGASSPLLHQVISILIKNEASSPLLEIRFLDLELLDPWMDSSIPINKGLIQAIPTSLPPQPIGEVTKDSNLQRIPPGVQARSHFTYCFVFNRTMVGEDVDTLTMEKYLALSQENQAPGVVKPKIGGNVNFEIKSQFMRELREDTFSGNKDEDAHDHINRDLSIVGLFNIPRVSKDAVWERTTRRNIGSSSSNDGLAALVGCQIWEGPHLDKDCPLNEEVKQVEEVRYGEFKRTTPFNGNNRGKFRVGPPGYYTKTDNRPPYGERRLSLEELLAKHQEKENFEQAKLVIVEHEGPSSPKKLKNLHGISFLSDSQEENTID